MLKCTSCGRGLLILIGTFYVVRFTQHHTFYYLKHVLYRYFYDFINHLDIFLLLEEKIAYAE